MSGMPLEELVYSCRKTYLTDYDYDKAIDIAIEIDSTAPLAAVQLLAEIYEKQHRHFKNQELRALWKMKNKDFLRLAYEAEKFRQIADWIRTYDPALSGAWENPEDKSAEIASITQQTFNQLARTDREKLKSALSIEVNEHLARYYPTYEVARVSYPRL